MNDRKTPIVELFAGIAGFGLGFESAGFESVVQVEISEPCRQLLESKYPGAMQVADVAALAAMHRRQRLGFSINEYWQLILELCRTAPVWCGGFPCQDLSVAGQRAGLAGERSGLWFVFRRLVALFRPPWVVIENVPGLLSSNGGRDLAVILRGLEKLGYRWAYRTLDAQYFGLAQRRERVFIVASLGNYGCAEVLFERESLCWDSPPSRETGKRITGTLSARSEAGGGLGSDFEIGGGLVENSQSPGQQHPPRRQRDLHPDAAHCLNGRGGAGRYDGESETFVAHTLRGEGFDASEDRTGRGTPIVSINLERERFACLKCGRKFGVNDYESNTVTCPNCGNTGIDTITDAIDGGDVAAMGFDSMQGGNTQQGASDEHAPPVRPHPRNCVAFQPRYFTRDNKTGGAPSDISPPVCAAESRSRGDAVTAVAFDTTQCTSPDNHSNPQPGDPCHPLASSAHTPAVAFTERSRADGRNFECQEDVSYALTNPGSGGRTHSRQIAANSTVRRLTPTECERLQGFPDGYTTGQSDSARYRQLGNAVAVPVAAWIARRLMTVIQSEE